jgi:hypothetical protein
LGIELELMLLPLSAPVVEKTLDYFKSRANIGP